MSEEINHDRRRFLRTAVMTIAAAELVMIGSANAQSSKINPADATTIKPGTTTSFGSLKQIDAGVLNVGYAEAGPTDGPAVILLHGWPYDIHSFVDVTPLLAAAGYRVIVPHLRGHGTTRFLAPARRPERLVVPKWEHAMRVIAVRTLKLFWEEHPRCGESFKSMVY